MMVLFDAVGGRERLFDHYVQGMNFTPSRPAFENMRDGMLQAASGDAADRCLIWEAFAQFGVGVGAKGTVKGPRVTITQSTVVPDSCTP
jgi:hypothetical protein